MAVLPIYRLPDEVLRHKAAPVTPGDARVGRLLDDMLETMYAQHGIGLAANQVGVLERVIVVDISEERDGRQALLMANPTLLSTSEDTFTYNEGCLCLPGQFADVTRPRRVRVAYADPSGKPQEIEAEDLLSQCLQHEIDHLNGVLFIDHLSTLRRGMFTRRALKQRQE